MLRSFQPYPEISEVFALSCFLIKHVGAGFEAPVLENHKYTEEKWEGEEARVREGAREGEREGGMERCTGGLLQEDVAHFILPLEWAASSSMRYCVRGYLSGRSCLFPTSGCVEVVLLLMIHFKNIHGARDVNLRTKKICPASGWKVVFEWWGSIGKRLRRLRKLKLVSILCFCVFQKTIFRLLFFLSWSNVSYNAIVTVSKCCVRYRSS